MADDNTLNDPELSRLERQLIAMALSPTLADRDRLLYACGQAAGRAQMKKRFQIATSAAAIFACASVGLGYLSLAHVGDATVNLDRASTPYADKQLLDSPAKSNVIISSENKDDRRGQMTAAWTFEQLVESDRDRPSALADATPRSSTRILRAADQSPLDEL